MQMVWCETSASHNTVPNTGGHVAKGGLWIQHNDKLSGPRGQDPGEEHLQASHIQKWLGAPTDVSNQGVISDNFLAKKGSWGDRSERGVMSVKLHKFG